MIRVAEIRVAVSPGERRIACMHDGVMQLAMVERPGRPDGVGDLHMARVSAVAPAMSGAFLQLAGDVTAFLPANDAAPSRRPIDASVHEGQMLAVRITRAAQGGKGPRVTAHLTDAQLAVVQAAPTNGLALLGRGLSATERCAERFATAAVITDSAALAALLRGRLGAARVRHEPAGAFDAALEDAFEQLGEPCVELSGGGRILIHPTPALTAIDVDAGSHVSSRDSHAVFRLNELAILEAARQIRLRNLGGAILLDLAGLSPKRREALLEPFGRALAEDPLPTKLLGLTRLGLFEVVRPRIHPPLHDILGIPKSPLSHGLAALRRAAREIRAVPGRALCLRAAPPVLAGLLALPGALDEYAALAGQALRLEHDAGLRPGAEMIEAAVS
jgi:Ribonuclease G/E